MQLKCTLASVVFILSSAVGFTTVRAQTAGNTAEATDTGALEEIVVSARRRTESLHDTPVAITAISTSQLESKAAMTIGDLQGAAPNILITQQIQLPA